MTVVSMNYLLEAGVHFGHQKRRWNPKMKEYIFTTRDDIYIIDLQKTVKKIEEAYDALKEIAANGGKILFVGTKKQAQEAVYECANRTNMYFVNERWLGGTLTNFKTIRNRIRRLDEIEKMEAEGTFDLLPKKEVVGIKKEYEKLFRNLSGIRDMKKVPEALIIVDPRKEDIAIKEARKLRIPVFGIVDTNCDPDMVDYVIPGNDDAVRSVKVMIGVLANAIAEANGTEMVDYITDEDKKNLPAAEEKVVDAKPVKAKKEETEAAADLEVVVEDEVEVLEETEILEEAPKKETKKAEKVETTEEEVVEVKEEAEPKKEKAPKEEKVDYAKMTVADLRLIANKKGIEAVTSMKKAELVAILSK